jgi:serine/threonine-protein kinase
VVPATADRIVLHALAKDRETRYQTAAEFRADIEAALAGRPISAVAAGAAAGAAGAATTQFLGAPGAGTRTMQPVTEPVPGAYGGAPVGGGMLPGAPVEEEYSYSRRERPPEPGRTNRTGTYVLLALAILLVAGLVAYTISKIGGAGTPAPTKIAVPSVVNQNVDDAKKALADKGFKNVQTKTANNDAPENTVFDQDPPANTSILPTDLVTLSVSAGPDKVTIPAGLKGKSLDDVRKILEDAGFKVGKTDTKDAPKLQQNQLVSTDPAEGASVPKGTVVNLVLATGNVELPNLRNKTLNVAVNTLSDLGLTTSPQPQYVDAPADAQPNVVVRTDPAAGSKVPVGGNVRIFVTRPVTQPSPSPTPTDSPSPSPSPSASTTP